MASPNLTKRQKKALAFRDRTLDKRNSRSKGELRDQLDVPESDVPVVEDQALAPAKQGDGGGEPGAQATGHAGRGKAGEEVVGGAQKRKRETRQGPEADKPKAKRRKGLNGDSVVDVRQSVDEKADKAKRRLILFLGNLKYTTTVEAIQAHFSKCDPPPIVRLLTPKPSGGKPSAEPVAKSKGCAFLEFHDRQAVQQALKLHHSQLDGRKINVELTAGGGGKGDTRLTKLKERNKELEGQRRKKQEKRLSSKVTQPAQQTEGAHRFSATSGAVQEDIKKRTWSVGDVEETKKHRGGKKHINKRIKPKIIRTGVNAIPVG